MRGLIMINYAEAHNGYAGPHNDYAEAHNGYAGPHNGYAGPHNGYVVEELRTLRIMSFIMKFITF